FPAVSRSASSLANPASAAPGGALGEGANTERVAVVGAVPRPGGPPGGRPAGPRGRLPNAGGTATNAETTNQVTPPAGHPGPPRIRPRPDPPSQIARLRSPGPHRPSRIAPMARFGPTQLTG